MPPQDRASLVVLIFAVNLVGPCAIQAADYEDRHGANHPAVLIKFPEPALVYIHDRGGALSKMELRAWVIGCLPGLEYSAEAYELDHDESFADLSGIEGKVKGRWRQTFTVAESSERDQAVLLRAEFPNPSPSEQHTMAMWIMDNHPRLSQQDKMLVFRRGTFYGRPERHVASGAEGPDQNQASRSDGGGQSSEAHSEGSCQNVRLIFLNPKQHDFIRVRSSIQLNLLVALARDGHGEWSTESEAQCGARKHMALENASVQVQLHESFNWLGHFSDIEGRWIHSNESSRQWQSSPLTLPSEQQILSFRAVLQVRLVSDSRRQEGTCNPQESLLPIELECEVHSQVQVVAARDSITIETLTYRPIALGAEIACDFIARILAPRERGTGAASAPGRNAHARPVCTTPPTVSLELVEKGLDGHVAALNTTGADPEPLCFDSGGTSRLVRGSIIYRDAHGRVLPGSRLQVRLVGLEWADQDDGGDQGSGQLQSGATLPTHVHEATILVPVAGSGSVAAAGRDELHASTGSWNSSGLSSETQESRGSGRGAQGWSSLVGGHERQSIYI